MSIVYICMRPFLSSRLAFQTVLMGWHVELTWQSTCFDMLTWLSNHLDRLTCGLTWQLTSRLGFWTISMNRHTKSTWYVDLAIDLSQPIDFAIDMSTWHPNYRDGSTCQVKQFSNVKSTLNHSLQVAFYFKVMFYGPSNTGRLEGLRYHGQSTLPFNLSKQFNQACQPFIQLVESPI